MSLPSKRLSISLVVTAVFLSACSGSTEDVRLTLCKDLAKEYQGTDQQLDWLAEDVVIQGYEDLEVRLKYEYQGGQGSMTCFYPYNTIDEDAMSVSNPAPAFDTYPNKVMQNGEVLDHRLVAKKINQVMLKQGKQALDSLKE